MAEFVAAVPYGFDPVDFSVLLREIPGVAVASAGARRRAFLQVPEDSLSKVREALPEHIVIEPVKGFTH